MRLWHESLLPLLASGAVAGTAPGVLRPAGWLLGQKTRGGGLRIRPSREYLAAYHYRVIREMDRRGYRWSPPGGSPAIAEGFVPAFGQTRGFSAFWRDEPQFIRSTTTGICGNVWIIWRPKGIRLEME